MSAYGVEAREFAANAADYLRRTEDEGDCLTITRAGEPVAVLAPVRRGMWIEEQPRHLVALARLPGDEAEVFAAGVRSARVEINGEALRDPWAR